MANQISSDYGDNFNRNPHSSLQPIDSASNIGADEKKLPLIASIQNQKFEEMVSGAGFSSPEETLEKSVEKIQNLDVEVQKKVGSVQDFETIGAVEDGNQEVAKKDLDGNQNQEFEAMITGASFSSLQENLGDSVEKSQNLDVEIEKKVGSVHDFETIGAVEDGNQVVAKKDLDGNRNQEFEAMIDCSSFSSLEENLGDSVEKSQNLAVEIETNVGSVHDFETIGAVNDCNQEVAKKDSYGNQDFEKEELVQEVQLSSAIEADGKEGLVRTEDLSRKEADSESILEMKKKLLLEKLEAMLVTGEEIDLEKGNNNPPSLGGMVDNCAKSMLIDEENMNVLRRSHLSLKNSLKIEVIDETALVEPVHVSKIGNVEEVGIVYPTRSMQIGVNKSQEPDRGVKKAKRSRRKAAREAKISEVHLNLGSVHDLVQVNEREKNAEGNKIVYSKKDMEALRFENVAEQKRLWKAICNELMPVVAREYSSLTSSNHPRKIGSTSGEGCSENLDGEIENMDGDDENVFSEPSCKSSVREDSDDDRYYNSIQRPAFLVEGEPNFDSGPPEDGLEFLRRARWEASRIPNVTVAKVDRSSFKKEQSVYMPLIPAIAKCPEHLLPSKEWEDAFLADFSKLRQALSCSEDSVQSDFILHEKFDFVTPDLIDQPTVVLPANDIDSQQPDERNASSSAKENSSSDYPSLSAISKMNSVFRISSLRKHINSFETQTTLSRTDCLWLFALSAAVDTPLDADTCAAFRSLLRKCASLRAEKTELDDEVIMLNILATISGRYFGQSEN